MYSSGKVQAYRRGLRSCLSNVVVSSKTKECEISNEYGSHAFLYK